MVHEQVAGNGIGSRALTRQVNYAYVTLITAHFQRYCRALHKEASQTVAAGVPDPELARVLEGLFSHHRLLDRGNPTPRNVGTDFDRFGFRLWEAVEVSDQRNKSRKEKLRKMCEWRNAIAHGDISRKSGEGKLVPLNLTLDTCRDWRRALGALAVSIDRVTATQCQLLGCQKPW